MRRGAGDAGAAIVEAAFVMPVLLALVLGLIDLGVAAFQSGAAASAARDGARAAMLDPTDTAAVRAAVVAHLAERASPTVTTSCTESCVAGTDRVTVTVSWPFRSVTGALSPIRTVSATSTMTVVGLPQAGSAATTTAPPTTAPPTTTTTTTEVTGPTTAPSPSTTTTTRPQTTTTAPGACGVQSLVIEGAPFGPKANGGLQRDMAFTLRTNGAIGCQSLAIRVDTGETSVKVNLLGYSPTYTAEIPKNAYDWTDGRHLVEVLAGSTVIQTTTVDV